jgi:hypothetical protein
MRKGDALRLLREELGLAETSTEYDFTVSDEPREDARAADWWRTTDTGLGETPRNKAYFRAYVRIANGGGAVTAGDRLPARGLRLNPKGRLWMDRYVIGKMFERGFVEYQEKPEGMYEPAFVVTDAGEKWSKQ